jgi:hypothetical protein
MRSNGEGYVSPPRPQTLQHMRQRAAIPQAPCSPRGKPVCYPVYRGRNGNRTADAYQAYCVRIRGNPVCHSVFDQYTNQIIEPCSRYHMPASVPFRARIIHPRSQPYNVKSGLPQCRTGSGGSNTAGELSSLR